MTENPDDPRLTPSDAAETEEQEASERSAVERGPREGARGARAANVDEDDPREEEGWTQPESSAQKGAIRDES
jgi:hypothetical protein